MMLKTFTLSILIASLLFFDGKFTSEKQIIGSWKVKSVDMGKMEQGMTAPQQKQMVDMLRKSLMNRTFNFKANHHFTVDGNLMGMDVKDAIWSFNAKSGIVKVTEIGKDKSRLLEVQPITGQNGQVTFLVRETPLKLSVEKAK